MKAKPKMDQSKKQQANKLPEGQERAGYVRPPEADEDPIDEAAAESFPASDPPSFTGATATPDSARLERRPSP